MSDPFVAEIRIFPFNFAPSGWALCDGQILIISQNTALFSLLGTTYGGDGRTTFALPNLQGAAPLHIGNQPGPGLSNYALGETTGTENVTLIQSEMPPHRHPINASNTVGGNADPLNSVWGDAGALKTTPNYYANAPGSLVQMNPSALSVSGGSLPHNNMMPYLFLNYCIAMQGIFPPRS